MKLLTRCDHALQAAHLANLLRAAGIRAETRNTALGGALGEIPWLECSPQVWIRDDFDWHRANEVLEASRRPQPCGAPWTCAGCGQWSEAQFAECWQCGRQRDGDNLPQPAG